MITLLYFLEAWLSHPNPAATLLKLTHSAAAALVPIGHLLGTLLDMLVA